MIQLNSHGSSVAQNELRYLHRVHLAYNNFIMKIEVNKIRMLTY
jgi:hypothetical protein